MRKLRIFEHMSLDGVIEQEDGYAYGAWTTPYRGPAGLALVLEAQGPRFDLLLGRHTYDLWSGYWPQAGNTPMANALNGKATFEHEVDRLLGKPWDDELEPFRRAGDGAPVRWLHAAG